MNDLVTVIIPTYNRETLLPDAINSVIEQTYKNWELIVVDDCSLDNTRFVVEKFCKVIGSKCKYYCTSNNMGNCGATARNIGIKNSSGEYILILDDDDMLEKTALEDTLAFLRRNNLSFVSVDRSFFPSVNNVFWEGYNVLNQGNLKQISLTDYVWEKYDSCPIYIRHSGSLSRRDVYLKVGFFDETLITWEDVEMLYRIKLFYNIGLLHKKLYCIRIHGNNYATGKKFDSHPLIEVHQRIKDFILNNRLNYLNQVNVNLANAYFDAGYKCRNHDKINALIYYLKSFKCNIRFKPIIAIVKLLFLYIPRQELSKNT